MACHRLIVTAESQDFDAKTLQNWRDEGFEASYLAYDKPPQSNRSYVDALEDTLKSMGSETYAIVGLSAKNPQISSHVLSGRVQHSGSLLL